MKNKQKRFGIRAIMALVAAVFMVGCYTKSDAPYDPNVSGKDPVYTATITVLDAASKAGVTGVTFNGITATGGTNGVYTFTPTTAGTYTFVVSKEGYEDAKGFVVFPSIGKDQTISTALTVSMTPKATLVAATYKVSVIAKDAKTGVTLENVSLAYGKRGAEMTTVEMATGIYDFAAETGIYDFFATKEGYVSAASSVLVEKVADGEKANEVLYNVVINMSQDVAYPLSGEVRDIETGELVTTGGKIFAVANNEIVATVNVGESGLFFFEGLTEKTTLFFQFGKEYQALSMNVDASTQNTVVAYLSRPTETQTSAVVEPTTESEIVLSTNSDNGVEMVIPAATTLEGVTVPQIITMSIEETISSDATTESTSMATVTFGPEGIQFSQPVELTYNNVPEMQQNVALRYFNEETGEWEVVDNSDVNGENSISFELDHFSTYDIAIMWNVVSEVSEETEKSTWTTPVDIEVSKFAYFEQVGVMTDFDEAAHAAGTRFEQMVLSFVKVMGLLPSYTESDKIGEGPAMTAEQTLIATITYEIANVEIVGVDHSFTVYTTTTSTEVVNSGDHYALYDIQHGGDAAHGSAAQHGGGSGF